MNLLDFKELPFGARARITWGFLWRSLLITLASAVVGGILGALSGFLAGMLGISAGGPWIAASLGALSGIVFMYLFVHWLFTTRIGQFRLAILSETE